MNRKTIQKILDELNKPTPSLDYIRGILDMLIEQLPADIKAPVLIFPNSSESAIRPTIGLQDEASMLDAEAKAMLGKLKPIQYE